MKRLVLFLDGTWNKADGSHPETNVVKLRDAVDRELSRPDPQRVYYDEGVGTGGLIDKFIGGAFGAGLARNVRQAYKYISRHYTPGDEVYLIGFSRGAYTARSVAGYIGVSGLLLADECSTEREAETWEYYHTPKHDRAPGDGRRLRAFCHSKVAIRCVAVFDTVGALGIPTEVLQRVSRSEFDFHNTRLGSHIEHAYHAMSIDEKRGPFEATLWEKPFNPLKPMPIVEQVWFPGVHSDIGGSYADGELSTITLSWMYEKLAGLGLRMSRPKSIDEDLRRHAIYGKVHESRKLLPYGYSYLRPRYRPIGGCLPPRFGRWRCNRRFEYDPVEERIHISAAERVRAGGYQPRNLCDALALRGTDRLKVVDWDGEMVDIDDVGCPPR